MAVGYSGLRSSVRYLGASSKAFFMNAAWPAASSLGGAAVRFIKGISCERMKTSKRIVVSDNNSRSPNRADIPRIFEKSINRGCLDGSLIWFWIEAFPACKSFLAGNR